MSKCKLQSKTLADNSKNTFYGNKRNEEKDFAVEFNKNNTFVDNRYEIKTFKENCKCFARRVTRTTLTVGKKFKQNNLITGQIDPDLLKMYS